MFIGKRLNYASNWPMNLIGVDFQKNNVSLLKVSSFLSARVLFLLYLNVLLAPSCPKFVYYLLCSSQTFVTVGICWSEASRLGSLTTFNFIVSKLEGKSGTRLWKSLIVSVVIGCELTIALASISNVCSALLFKLLPCVFRSAFRMLLSVLISRTHNPLVSHDDCGFHKNFGIWNHLSILAKFLKFVPLEVSFAGFSFDGRYFHCLTLLFSCIMCPLFATKVLNALVSLAMYPNITLLPVQKYSLSSCSCNSYFHW